MDEPSLSIDLNQLVLALEETIDLVGINDRHHGKRVAYIALQIAHQLGFADEHQTLLFRLGMLHDCGVSSDEVHSTLVNIFDWEEAHAHCEQGFALLCNLEPLVECALPIRYHHCHWPELLALDLDPTVKRLANLIFLADRIDISAAPYYQRDILLAKESICSLIELYSGDFFDPELVAGFLQAATTEAFWIALEDQHVNRFAWDFCRDANPQLISNHQLRQFAHLFAYIVDQKSPFTAHHSINVGRLAQHLAELSGLSPERAEQVEIAGYLHDLGKLKVPDYILEKPGPLSPTERSLINHHSYETFEILRPIKGFEEIARWAAYHHENLRGTGYPFHPSDGALDLESKIIAVADVMQALGDNRPYREGLNCEQTLQTLKQMAEDGKLDADLVERVALHHESCFQVALSRQWSSDVKQ